MASGQVRREDRGAHRNFLFFILVERGANTMVIQGMNGSSVTPSLDSMFFFIYTII